MKASEAKDQKRVDETEIRAVLTKWADSIHNKEVDGLMSHYADAVVFFDLAPPLQLTSPKAYRKSLEVWFSSFDGPIGYKFTKLEINVAGDVAFTNSINHLSGKREDGEQTDVWVRATFGLRKIDGRWLVTHEHVSVPFYMDGSLRAAVDLKP